MDWQFKVGIGAAIVFGLLPFLVKEMPAWIAMAGICAGILFIIWGCIPGHGNMPLGPSLLLIASVAGMVGGAIWFVQSPSTAGQMAVPSLEQPLIAIFIAIVSAFGTFGNFIVNLFNYIQKGKPQPMFGEAASITNVGRPSRARVIMWGIVSGGLIVLTLFLIGWFQEDGTPGPPGPPGPQGIPGNSTHLSVADVHAMKLGEAAAKLLYFEGETEEFAKAVDQYRSESDNVLKAYINQGSGIGVRPPRTSVEDSRLKQMISQDFNVSVDLSRHPRFDENQNIPAPGDDKISNDYQRTEYRKIYDTVMTSNRALTEWQSRYSGTLADSRRLLESLMRQH